MDLIELALAIDAMKTAIAAAARVAETIDDHRLGRSGAEYVTDLKFTLASCERALATRLADGEVA